MRTNPDCPNIIIVELASLEIRLARSENLPVLPQAVSSVLKLADDPNASPRDLEKVIERDPAITAKILRVANSSYYGGNRIPTIGRAISFLGMNSVRSLVVGVAFQQMISGRSASSQFDKVAYWQHSLAVATACRIFGKIVIPTRAEELYCIGMMHDIGKLILDRFMPEVYDVALAEAKAFNLPLHKVEMEKLGFDHAEVGGLLAKKWGLGTMAIHAVKFHHNPAEDGEYFETTSIVSIANDLAHQAGFDNGMPGVEYEVDQEVFATLGLPEEQLKIIGEVMSQEVAKAQDAFKINI